MYSPAPTRVDRNAGADAPTIRMVIDRPNQKHIRTITPGHYWVDLPADVFISVRLGDYHEGRSLPDYTVTTWRNAYDRRLGDK